jgi:23S rRNA (cytosine1962-C5)-methyltransferase
VRGLEGLPPRSGIAYGQLADAVLFHEDGLAYRVDVVAGQKTGFYLDQRDSRRRCARSARARGAERVLLHRRLHLAASPVARRVCRSKLGDALALARENLASTLSRRCPRRVADADAFSG